MSGHSKWAQIKRQKGAADKKRGQAFTKLANAITIAVGQGGGVADPEQNFRLRLAIEKAREINMPKENVQRAIDRATGKGDKGILLEEVVYEGIGQFGSAFIIEAVTDNKLRTTGEVRSMLEKYGVTPVTPGAASYQFEKRGVIVARKNGQTADDILMLVADAGGEDIEEVGDEVYIYTKAGELAKVRHALQDKLVIKDAKLSMLPTVSVSIADKEVEKRMGTLLQALEDLDDVQEVYVNFTLENA